MKNDYHILLGEQVNLTASEAVWQLMNAVCESIQSSKMASEGGKNIFGRPVSVSVSADIPLSIGFTATGLRSGIILNPGEISSSVENIISAVRRHVPLVIFARVTSHFQVGQLAMSGAVVLSAISVQEALDMMLIAYRVAELSLIPVVVCMDDLICDTEEVVLFPDKEVLFQFAENTDHQINSPTPAQQIIFGNKRKLIPGWFNPDLPGLVGAYKQPGEAALETAASKEYFFHHLDQILQDTYLNFFRATNRQYDDIKQDHQKNSEYLAIAYGSILFGLEKAVDEARMQNNKKVASICLQRISPFPAKAVGLALSGKKALTILEQSSIGNSSSDLNKEIFLLPETGQIKLYTGYYNTIPGQAALSKVIDNMLPGGIGKTNYWIDIDFTHTNSSYPKHLVLLQSISRGYPDVQQKTLSSRTPSLNSQRSGDYIPLNIRKYQDQGPAYTKVSRFYDDVASLFHSDPEEMTADPFQAVPFIPPATANFDQLHAGREKLPVFIPSKCTGCGDCFLSCPHAAINPIVIGVESLLKAGMTISSANGVRITQLTPLVKNIAKGIHEEFHKNELGIASLEIVFSEAFNKIEGQLKLEGDKLQAARQDMKALTEVLKDFQFSVTDTFYKEPNLVKPGQGELFSLAIDINACNGCTICASACNESALIMDNQGVSLADELRSGFALWEQLPDTGGDTITRLLDEKEYNPFSALMLSRYFNQAVSGTSKDIDGDGQKTVVHHLLAMAEATLQPGVIESINIIDELISGLSKNIHKNLSDALPEENFDTLANALDDIKEDRKPFEEVMGKMGSGEHMKLLDTKSLRRKVELTKSLKTMKWLLSEGATGNGRSRYGIVLDDTYGWSNTYPWNNFSTPVFMHTGNSPGLVRGLVQGQIRHIIDNIKMLRRAELESENRYDPDINDIEISNLSWNSLTEKEKNMLPPIVLFGSKRSLAGKDMDALLGLLDTDWPVKVIILDDAIPSFDQLSADISAGLGYLLPMMSTGKVQVLKGSLAEPHSLFRGMTEILYSKSPAIAWVYTPSVSGHVMSVGHYNRLYDLSKQTRAFPVFSYDPARKGKLLSSGIDINGNPDPLNTWIVSELEYIEEGSVKSVRYTWTWADWAYSMKIWKDKFMMYKKAMGNPVNVADFIMMSPDGRKGNVPVIFRLDQNKELNTYMVPKEVVEGTEACASVWQLILEISGELSEFPEKLHAKLEKELSGKYEKELAEVRAEYENKISGLEQEYLEKIRIRLKEKLVSLSHYPKNKV